jgi:tetratricopeptide (TPR) repeat protein
MGDGSTTNGASGALAIPVFPDGRKAGSRTNPKGDGAPAAMNWDPVERGERMLREGRHQEALAWFDSQEGVAARFGAAVALQLLGRLDEAEEAWELVLESGENPEALANLVALNVERFDLDRVERYSGRLLAADADSLVAWQGLLVVAVERRDFETAAKCFARLDGRTAVADDRAIQYRLSRATADRLRGMRGSHAASAGAR